MEEKNKIEGTYWTGSGEQKDFSMEVDIPEIKDEKVKRLLGMMHNPLLLIFQGGASGLVAARKVIVMLVLFAFANVLLIFYALWRFFIGDATISELPWVFAVLGVGVLCTAIASYKGYQFVLMDALRVCYRSMKGVFHTLCSIIIDKAAEHKNLSSGLNIRELISQRFNKLPSLLRSALRLILGRIPLLDMVNELSSDIQQGNKEQASQKLFTKMDAFIEDSLFSKNNNQWMWIIFLINLLVSLILIVYKIG